MVGELENPGGGAGDGGERMDRPMSDQEKSAEEDAKRIYLQLSRTIVPMGPLGINDDIRIIATAILSERAERERLRVALDQAVNSQAEMSTPLGLLPINSIGMRKVVDALAALRGSEAPKEYCDKHKQKYGGYYPKDRCPDCKPPSPDNRPTTKDTSNSKVIEGLQKRLSEVERELERAVALYARKVMDALKEHGPSIVPHLMDDDDNDGQRLREALDSYEAGGMGK